MFGQFAELCVPDPLEPELCELGPFVPVAPLAPELPEEELELAAFATAAPPPMRAPHTANATRLSRIFCRICRSPPSRMRLSVERSLAAVPESALSWSEELCKTWR
jgi:hypothetical protein